MLAGAPFIGFIPTTDLARARSFYEGTLGLRCTDDNPVACVFDANGTMLRVTAVPELTGAGYTVAGWRVDDIGTAGKALLGKGFKITQERGKWREGPQGTAVLTTFHPAYLLRLEDDALARAEAAVNEDLAAVKARLAVERGA